MTLRLLAYRLRPLLAILASASAGESKPGAGAVVGLGAAGALGVGKLLAGAEHAGSALSHVASGAEHAGSALAHSGSSLEHLAPPSALEHLTTAAEHPVPRLGESPVGLGEVAHDGNVAAVELPGAAALGSPETVASILGVPGKPGLARAVQSTPVRLISEAGGAPASSAVRFAYQRRTAQLVDTAISGARKGSRISRRDFTASLNRAVSHSADPGLMAARSQVDSVTGKWALHFRAAGQEFEADLDAFELLENVLSTGNDLLSLIPDGDDAEDP